MVKPSTICKRDGCDKPAVYLHHWCKACWPENMVAESVRAMHGEPTIPTRPIRDAKRAH